MTLTKPRVTPLAPTTKRAFVVGILASLKRVPYEYNSRNLARPKSIPWILFRSSNHARGHSHRPKKSVSFAPVSRQLAGGPKTWHSRADPQSLYVRPGVRLPSPLPRLTEAPTIVL